MLRAVDDAAWQQTGAVRWSFRGNREHLWDRRRSLARVGWDDVEVLLDLSTREGLVTKKGRSVTGDRREKLTERAYAYWVNDSFWLNPVSKVFDSGTVRSLVTLDDGTPALLVEYTSGGLTPGDAYLWIVDEKGLPTTWRMWVSSLPVGGTKASWEQWETLATGARIATLHDLRLGSVTIGNLAGAQDLAALLGGDPDPFELLLKLEGGG